VWYLGGDVREGGKRMTNNENVSNWTFRAEKLGVGSTDSEFFQYY